FTSRVPRGATRARRERRRGPAVGRGSRPRALRLALALLEPLAAATEAVGGEEEPLDRPAELIDLERLAQDRRPARRQELRRIHGLRLHGPHGVAAGRDRSVQRELDTHHGPALLSQAVLGLGFRASIGAATLATGRERCLPTLHGTPVEDDPHSAVAREDSLQIFVAAGGVTRHAEERPFRRHRPALGSARLRPAPPSLARHVGRIEPDDLVHDEDRAVLDLLEDTADILTEQADDEELEAEEEGQR